MRRVTTCAQRGRGRNRPEHCACHVDSFQPATEYYSPNQYANEANFSGHYRGTGPELWEQTDGKITHFFTGVGTGGTITGVGHS